MRNDPWNEWRRLWRAGTMLRETLAASHKVVSHRQQTIKAAINDPIGADHIELGRMVSEKATAFGAAGSSLALDWWAMQADLGAQATALGSMLMGQIPGPKATQAMLARGHRLGSAALSSSTRAMVPIHRAATANERRLRRGQR